MGLHFTRLKKAPYIFKQRSGLNVIEFESMIIKRSIIFILFIFFSFCSKKVKNQKPFFNVKEDAKDETFQDDFVIGTSHAVPLYKKEDKNSIHYNLPKGIYELFNRFFFLSKDENIKEKGKTFINQLNKNLGLENEIFQKILDKSKKISFIDFEEKNIETFLKEEEKRIKELSELLLDPKLEKDFVLSQKKDLEYLKKHRILYYMINYGKKWDDKSHDFIPNDKKLNVQEKEKLEALIKKSDFNDEFLFKKGFFYRSFLSLYMKIYNPLNPSQNQNDYFLNQFNLIDAFFKSSLIKEHFWFNLIKNHIIYEDSSTFTSSYNLYQSKSKNLNFKNYIEFLYKSSLKLEKEMKVPDFDYEKVNGKKAKLSEFKGNYLYIHVWATWCGPCINDFSSLKKIKEKYKDKPIKFIGISLDSNKDKWKEMIKTQKLDDLSTEFIVDKDFKSDFSKFFKIRPIPRYILLDKEGKILERSAPGPDEIETLLNSYIK